MDRGKEYNFFYAIKAVKQLLVSFICLMSLIIFPTVTFGLSGSHSTKQLHLISITPTKPFPAEVSGLSTTIAKFDIMNIGWTPLTVQDSTQFPTSMRLSASTCNKTLNPGEICTLTLELKAPITPQVLNMQLIEVAIPQEGIQDVVRHPIVVRIVEPSSYTITPSAEEGGTIQPNTPQAVKTNGSITFTATPQPGYQINKWFLDNAPVQAGKANYTLSNIHANHSVSVTFMKEGPQPPFVGISFYNNGDSPSWRGQIAVSKDHGENWQSMQLANNTKNLLNIACTGEPTDLACMAVSRTSVFVSNNLTSNTWQETLFKGVYLNSGVIGCSQGGKNATCIAAGNSDKEFKIALTNDGGKTWQMPIISSAQGNLVKDVSCAGSGKNVLCAFIGLDFYRQPILFASNDGGKSWWDSSYIPPTSAILWKTSCTGNTQLLCTVVGMDGLLLATNDGITWTPQQIENKPLGLYLKRISCNGDGATAMCIALGGNNDKKRSMVISVDGGKRWVSKNLPFDDYFNLGDVQCTGSREKSFCVLIGNHWINPESNAIIATSTDEGDHWEVREFTSTPTAAYSLSHLACHGVGKSTSCAAVGSFKSNSVERPLAIITNDGGATWKIKTAGLPTSDVYLSHITTLKE